MFSIWGHVESPVFLWLIPLPFLLAAMVKSAQFPFSSWLPRAMEGPTTSSAIFYGSLSVHIGVYLLVRTAPLWDDVLGIKILIAGVGLATTIVASYIAKVQSTIKTQIAYSGVAQIGIMFIEVALGWYALAMVHFVSHAFLRSYQLLVSPSVLSYRIHDQFFHFTPPAKQSADGLWNKIRLSIYILSIKEFNLDRFMTQWLWRPLKKSGELASLIPLRVIGGVFIPLFFAGLYLVYHPHLLSLTQHNALSLVFGLTGVIFIARSFVERDSALVAWLLILLNQLYITLSIGLNEQFDFTQVHLYLSGIFVSAAVGGGVLYILSKKEKSYSLQKFQGHVYEHPRLALIFALACLGLAGFPITPAFLGEDLMLGHIHSNQYLLMSITVLNLILDGLVVFRIYSRLFLGPQEKGYHETAYRSA
ncbi:MAG: proton-conducting transporter membrane subunit [Saprospiraceae bacterium]